MTFEEGHSGKRYELFLPGRIFFLLVINMQIVTNVEVNQCVFLHRLLLNLLSASHAITDPRPEL